VDRTQRDAQHTRNPARADPFARHRDSACAMQDADARRADRHTDSRIAFIAIVSPNAMRRTRDARGSPPKQATPSRSGRHNAG